MGTSDGAFASACPLLVGLDLRPPTQGLIGRCSMSVIVPPRRGAAERGQRMVSRVSLSVVPGDNPDPAELVKAAAEGSVAGAFEAIVGPISAFLGKLFGEPAEQLGGWASDAIAFRRWKARIRTMQKAEAFLLEAGFRAARSPAPCADADH
jgi:hypothetical protein